MTSPLTRILRTALPALALTTAVAACGDPLSARASLPTYADTLTVYALSDSSAARRDFPTALLATAQTAEVNGQLVVQPSVTSATGVGDFDVAFDLDASGKVVIIPQRRLLPGFSGRQVGLQVVDQPFEALTDAPRSGYTFDTAAVVVAPKRTVVLQTQVPACFNDSRGASARVFSKLVVDSVQDATRAIFFRLVVDPNCGFRSLQSGVPGR